jgi:acetyltransferase-like isoleucine patch superfamily enzyme
MNVVELIKKAIKAGPKGILSRVTKNVPPGLCLLNLVIQRILRINAQYDWMIHFTSRVVGKNIKIGKNVWFSFAVSGGSYFQGGNGIIIGDDTIFAPNVCFISANHDPDNLRQWKIVSPIVIGKNCWIGAGA